MIFNFFPVIKDIQVVAMDLYTICLHVSIAFLYCLCQLLLFPRWNFFLPAFLNQLFLAFELRFILCTLACSYWFTPGSWQKTSGYAISWAEEVVGMWAVVPDVCGKFPLLLKDQSGYAQINSRITSGFFGWPRGLAHSSILGFCSCDLV